VRVFSFLTLTFLRFINARHAGSAPVKTCTAQGAPARLGVPAVDRAAVGHAEPAVLGRRVPVPGKDSSAGLACAGLRP
jgi:hypothetical protein